MTERQYQNREIDAKLGNIENAMDKGFVRSASTAPARRLIFFRF